MNALYRTLQRRASVSIKRAHGPLSCTSVTVHQQVRFLSAHADAAEMEDWLESLDALVDHRGAARATEVLEKLLSHARRSGVAPPVEVPQSPYFANTVTALHDLEACDPVPPSKEEFALERRIEELVLWNSTMLVHHANKLTPGLGGHIATYASLSTVYEVALNHFIQGKGADNSRSGDQVFWSPHSAPGIYARAFLEGRLPLERMMRFRQEARAEGPGLCSYPHPHLMPDFWEFATSSMGLNAAGAIYQARFNRYLEHRGLVDTSGSRIWSFLGDGEMDEAESTGLLAIAAREKLDNIVFIVSCNLQSLDGPVRGNSKVIQELEGIFAGTGWRVLKCVWGREWENLLAKDSTGELKDRLENTLDGDWQLWNNQGPEALRHGLFNTPALQELVADMADEDLAKLCFGGHDADAVHRTLSIACQQTGQPTVVLVKTVKGYRLGSGIAGANTTHMAKVLKADRLKELRDRLSIPISDEVLDGSDWPFYIPPSDSPEMQHIRRCRDRLGGPLPHRHVSALPVTVPSLASSEFAQALKGFGERAVSTTQVFGGILQRLLKNKDIGERVVPIVPDEGRTFGLEAMFATSGIYRPSGQQYKPTDADTLLAYKEAQNGQVLQEGICEAGAIASFTCAGTAYSTHNFAMMPFYCFYSMFGFQRSGDQIWQFGDMHGRGFLMGGTAGRTTLSGEGLQHEDGQSHLQACVVPNLRAYDPAYAYELAVIIQDGLRLMMECQEDIFYYITMYNENYEHPPLPENAEEGILAGIYRVREADCSGVPVQLLGSGTILKEALKAQMILKKYGVAADVWSVTSYQMLRREAMEVDRWNRLNPDMEARIPFVTRALQGGSGGPTVAVTDYITAVPDLVARWVPGLTCLGTDGYGRSDTRTSLRKHFEIDAEAIAFTALSQLCRSGSIAVEVAKSASEDLEVDAGKPIQYFT
eukprot:gnl/MRDRNA2_/MRDRNA2_117337_c0_seq1.p1 gnl/MRDRNA2_/MRDRNA2_117337_c0~~gnl/MRDRNA2_/MRDRNA2_117337_c0_seq1.p1  ORF type:complete len:934 (+),score=156.10 gnl/MRDRNA2_/MRDRNA2_117337_c0_seq1:115-2916(+)